MNAKEKNNVDSFHYKGFQSYGYIIYYVYVSLTFPVEQNKFPQRNQVLTTITPKTFIQQRKQVKYITVRVRELIKKTRIATFVKLV